MESRGVRKGDCRGVGNSGIRRLAIAEARGWNYTEECVLLWGLTEACAALWAVTGGSVLLWGNTKGS